MVDEQTGLRIRFVKEWDLEPSEWTKPRRKYLSEYIRELSGWYSAFRGSGCE